jgi:hypothetical protein
MTAFRGTDESNCTPARLGSGFKAADANRFPIELFVRCEVIESVAKGIFAHNTEIETLATVDCIGGREANESSKIEDIRRFYGVLRHAILSAGESGNQADSYDRRKAIPQGRTTPQGPPQRWAAKSAVMGQTRGHLYGVLLVRSWEFFSSGPESGGMKTPGTAEIRDTHWGQSQSTFSAIQLSTSIGRVMKSGRWFDWSHPER